MTEFTQLTPVQLHKAMDLFTKLGNLPIYTKLPHGVKRSAACTAIASTLGWSVTELADAVQTSEEFRTNVEALIATYEVEHPEKVNQEEALLRVMNDIATAGMTDLPNSAEEAQELMARIGGAECDDPTHDHSAEPAQAGGRMVGFSAQHMGQDGTPDAKVDAEFAAMVEDFETAEAPEPKGRHRFITDTEGSTEDGGK